MKLEIKGANQNHELSVRPEDIVVLDGNMITVARDSFSWTYVLTEESTKKVEEVLNG